MKKIFLLMGCIAGILLLVTLNAYATTISAGVPDSGIISREFRDGAGGINFIDLSSPISGDGWITSWSIFAQSHGPWVDNTEPRQVGLVIFRNTGTGYMVVGESSLETISTWDRKYTFNDLGSGIQVKSGDYLGWYYPVQGDGTNNPGGVIAFDLAGGTHNVLFNTDWGSQPKLAVGDSAPYTAFTLQLRTYSINVSGTAVPVPASLLLLGSGLLGLVGLRRFKKS
jgi:hypothetical protein